MEQETAFTTRENTNIQNIRSQYLDTLAVTDIKNEQSEEIKKLQVCMEQNL